jgi:hypothetical protein
VVVEVVPEAGVAFGFPGPMGVDPPKGLAIGSRPAPRIIDAICIIPRRVSGFDLLELLARKATESEYEAQTSFDGTVRSGISHGLADPWRHIGDFVPGLVRELLDSTSRKTFVVRTQGSSSSSAAVHLSNFSDI